MKIYKHIIFIVILFCMVLPKNFKKSNQTKILKKMKMIKHLDLDEKQSERLFVREKDLDNQYKIINDKKNALRRKMKEIREGGNMSQSKVDQLIDEMHELDYQKKALKKDHHKGVSDILNPTQRLKYVNFDDHFKKVMKDKIKKKPRKTKKGYKKPK